MTAPGVPRTVACMHDMDCICLVGDHHACCGERRAAIFAALPPADPAAVVQPPDLGLPPSAPTTDPFRWSWDGSRWNDAWLRCRRTSAMTAPGVPRTAAGRLLLEVLEAQDRVAGLAPPVSWAHGVMQVEAEAAASGLDVELLARALEDYDVIRYSVDPHGEYANEHIGFTMQDAAAAIAAEYVRLAAQEGAGG